MFMKRAHQGCRGRSVAADVFARLGDDAGREKLEALKLLGAITPPGGVRVEF